MPEPTSVKTAVILAAGIGSRIQNLWADAPKGLLSLGDTPIVERSIKQLLSHGITEIVLVTGHHAAQFEPLAARYPGIKTVYNPLYATSGSMYSLYCARHLLQDVFLLLESDLIYEDRALAALIACPHTNATVVSGFTHAGDEAFTEVKGDRVKRISKQREELANVTGEMIGISKVSPALFQAMVAYAEQSFQEDLKLEYYSGCLNAIIEQIDLFCCKIDDLIWAEIDDGAQWQRAREKIFPQLLAASGQPI